MKSILLMILISLTATTVSAQQAYTPVEGVNYHELETPVQTGGKIQVAEFFWYGCGHCYNFEPMLEQWKKTLAEDVVVIGSPAVWNKPIELHARAFYAAQALDVMDTMHPVIFQAMNVDRKRLSSEAEIQALFEANGVSAEDFSKAYNSFGVGSQVRQANSRARAAKITGKTQKGLSIGIMNAVTQREEAAIDLGGAAEILPLLEIHEGILAALAGKTVAAAGV